MKNEQAKLKTQQENVNWIGGNTPLDTKMMKPNQDIFPNTNGIIFTNTNNNILANTNYNILANPNKIYLHKCKQ
jgi:hypothetical protein